MKKEREVQALAILTQVYKSKDRAQSQVEVIRTSVADSSNEHFFESLKYIFQWKIIQRSIISTKINNVLNKIICLVNSQSLVGILFAFAGTLHGWNIHSVSYITK